MLLAHPIKSALARGSSLTGESSRAESVRVLVQRLNARELCKFNFHLVPQEAWYNVAERLAKMLTEHKDFGYYGEEAVMDDMFKNDALACPYCICAELTNMKNKSRTAGV